MVRYEDTRKPTEGTKNTGRSSRQPAATSKRKGSCKRGPKLKPKTRKTKATAQVPDAGETQEPEHALNAAVLNPPEVPSRAANPFSRQEDVQIWRLRHQQLGWAEISRRPDRPGAGDSIRQRFNQL